jgi:hypothetical protein
MARLTDFHRQQRDRARSNQGRNLARFSAPFDLAALRTIYSPVFKSHEKRHSSSAAEEQKREGHHPEEERVEMVH